MEPTRIGNGAGLSCLRPEAPLTCIGPYDLLEVVGRGGMGVVYRGRNRETGQVVAVKLLTARMLSEPVLRQRFVREFRVASRLSHPNLVRGLDAGVEGDRPYLVLEFVEGVNLRQLVAKQGPLPEAPAVDIAIQVAGALQLAHEQKLIHRDVKPDNILLIRNGWAKLTDLGLIKDLGAEANLTLSRTCLGTMAFMPPEQFQDAKRVDARCDVYSLAATLYFALTGVVPFQGRGERTSMAKKLRNEIERPSTLFPALRPGLSDTICKALDANPNCRPASCRAFAHALRGALGGARTGRLGRGTADGAERRAAARHPVALRASCRSRPESPRQFPAEVRDISQTGIQLALGRRFEPGATLLVQVLSHPPRGPMRIQVCWARDVSPQQWALGCEFERSLTEDELHALIGQGTSPVVVREGR